MSGIIPEEWHVGKTGDHQGLIIGGGGENIAVCYDKKHAALIAAAPAMLEALKEIAERGPVEGYTSASALRLRLVGTQSIARAAIDSVESEVAS